MFNIPQNGWQAFFEKEMRKSYFSGLCAELKKDMTAEIRSSRPVKKSSVVFSHGPE